ncbi:MAG: hypothetical protein C4542_08120 [Dehalococcoidia bacterium]|nr:MAG: hypothetical protein C4542_08120 [Dehalococcoidia bacterium]
MADTETKETIVTEAAVEGNEDNYGGFDSEDPVVKIAESHGWLSKDKYKGDAEKWTTPDKYINAQWDINDATKNSNKRLERTVEQLEKQLSKISRGYEEMNKREQNKVQSELKELRKQAIEEGDAAKVDQIDEQIETLKQGDAGGGEPAVHPAVDEWMGQNEWYRPGGKGAPAEVQDIVELVEELNGLDEYSKLSPQFRLAKIDREVASYVEMRRPDLIGKYKFNGIKPATVNGKAAPKADDDDDTGKTRRSISDVEGNVTRGGRGAKGISYDSLNETEKAMCDSQTRAIPGYTKEEWLKDYAMQKARG